MELGWDISLIFSSLCETEGTKQNRQTRKKSTTPDMSYSCLAATYEVCRIFRLKQRRPLHRALKALRVDIDMCYIWLSRFYA